MVIQFYSTCLLSAAPDLQHAPYFCHILQFSSTYKKGGISPGHATSDLTLEYRTESTYTHIPKDSVHISHRIVYCCYKTIATEVQQCVIYALLYDMLLLIML
jgi:hypothetical protein